MSDRRQLPLPFGPIRNSNFLSNHWLDNRLPLEPEWAALRDPAMQLLDRLEALWTGQRGRLDLESADGAWTLTGRFGHPASYRPYAGDGSG